MELIDVLTSDGAPTGITKPKALAHRDGDLHRSVHVWLIASDGRVLVQLRSHRKENHPGLWDVSCAGHLSAGESAIDAAIREADEELGLELQPNELRHIATLRERSVLNRGTYIENEIHEIYVDVRDVDLSALDLQREEVDDARLVTWDEFASLDRVPHDEEYALVSKLVTE
ncbi:MAG TPA: NUDIX domain-containing protein [Thermoanaerobaculia bacterium]|nr:NUDIX domain-containing protein [Thermoanaerobaculia bacterium]